MLLKISMCIPKPVSSDLRHCFPPLVLLNTLYKSFFFFFSFFSISQIVFSKYLVTFLLQSSSSSEVSLWNSVLNIQGNTKNYYYIYFINPVFSDPFDDVESLKNENQTVQNMWEHKITKTDLAILNHRNIRTTATKR